MFYTLLISTRSYRTTPPSKRRPTPRDEMTPARRKAARQSPQDRRPMLRRRPMNIVKDSIIHPFPSFQHVGKEKQSRRTSLAIPLRPAAEPRPFSCFLHHLGASSSRPSRPGSSRYPHLHRERGYRFFWTFPQEPVFEPFATKDPHLESSQRTARRPHGDRPKTPTSQRHSSSPLEYSRNPTDSIFILTQDSTIRQMDHRQTRSPWIKRVGTRRDPREHGISMKMRKKLREAASGNDMDAPRSTKKAATTPPRAATERMSRPKG